MAVASTVAAECNVELTELDCPMANALTNASSSRNAAKNSSPNDRSGTTTGDALQSHVPTLIDRTPRPVLDNTDSSAEPPVSPERDRSAAAIALLMTPLCLSVTLSALDLTIVTPAIPAIVGSFKSVQGYVWIGSAFVLANTASTPIWGTVADIWGRKPIILISVAIFSVGSLVCALAQDMKSVVAGRAVQGLGASGMSTMVNVIICDTFSLRDRGFYLAITSVVWAIMSAVGPVIGGILTTRLSWRWCFWVNLPVSGVVFFVLLGYLKIPSPKTSVVAGLKMIDWTGSILIVGGVLMVLLGLDFGDVTYPWSSATVICLTVFGAVAVGMFILVEWKVSLNPIIPLRLFSTTSSSAAYAVFSFNFYVFTGIAYYLPLYSQSVLGADALGSGLHLLPIIVACSLAAAFSGVFIQKTGKYLSIMYVSQIMLTLGSGLLISLDVGKDLTKLFIFEIIVGVGVGMNIEPPVLAAQASMTVRDTAAVIATMGFLRSIANAVSIVLGGVIFQNEMNKSYSDLREQLGDVLARNFKGDQAAASVELIGSLPISQQNFVREAYYNSLRTIWIMYVAFAGLSLVLNLFVRSHHLRTNTEDAVLGIERRILETRNQSTVSDSRQIELSDPPGSN